MLIIVLSLKLKVRRGIILTLLKKYLMLFKGEVYIQYLDIIWFFIVYRLANI